MSSVLVEYSTLWSLWHHASESRGYFLLYVRHDKFNNSGGELNERTDEIFFSIFSKGHIITRKKKFNYNLRTAMYQETKTRGFVRNFIGLALAKAQNQRLC